MTSPPTLVAISSDGLAGNYVDRFGGSNEWVGEALLIVFPPAGEAVG